MDVALIGQKISRNTLNSYPFCKFVPPADFPQPTHTFTSVGCQLTVMIGDVPFSPIIHPGGPAPLRRQVLCIIEMDTGWVRVVTNRSMQS